MEVDYNMLFKKSSYGVVMQWLRTQFPQCASEKFKFPHVI